MSIGLIDLGDCTPILLSYSFETTMLLGHMPLVIENNFENHLVLDYLWPILLQTRLITEIAGQKHQDSLYHRGGIWPHVRLDFS